MADWAHEWTDKRIERLRRRFDESYAQAAREMREKLELYLAQYDEANGQWKEMVSNGEATREQYRAWLRSQSVRRDYLVDMCDTLARDATRANQLAMSLIDDEIPSVYAQNANYAAYGIETHIRRNTHAFDLVDESTVRRLMDMPDDGQVAKEVTTDEGSVEPPLVMLRKTNFDEAKDVRWNRQKFNSAITQSILQGESIPAAAKRLSQVLGMSRNMAVRAARTAITSAENAGRTDSYRRARKIGIELEQEWLATLDERTRHSHRELDGQHVPVGEKFKVPSSGHELEFPADPKADPSEVWNCRCTLVAWFPEDGQESMDGRWSRLPKGMTYEEWKGQKAQETAAANDGNPTELAGVRRGAPMTFAEANEMRGNPNYDIARAARERLVSARDAYYGELNGQVESASFDRQRIERLKKEMEDAERAYAVARREQNGYRENCQTCVVANEARRRGYDVQAKANTSGSVSERLSRRTNLAWIDPTTGTHPRYIRYDGEGRSDTYGEPIPTHRRFVQWLQSEGTIEAGARYTIEFGWKGRSRIGHIVCIERTDDGLRMYDPQCGETYDERGISEYLKQVKFKSTSGGLTYADGPQLLKVSDYDFDTSICDMILEGAGNGSAGSSR